jgi:hypothetical protein
MQLLSVLSNVYNSFIFGVSYKMVIRIILYEEELILIIVFLKVTIPFAN